MVFSIRVTDDENQRIERLIKITGLGKGTIVKMSLADTLNKLERAYEVAA